MRPVQAFLIVGKRSEFVFQAQVLFASPDIRSLLAPISNASQWT
jgi:hypothetical protein